MGVFDPLFLKITDTLITRLGGKCTVEISPKLGTGGYDYLAGQSSPQSPISYANIPCTPPYPYKKYQIDGTNIKQGDFQILLPAKTLNAQVPSLIPDIAGVTRIIRDGKRFQVISIEPINSGDQVVAYVLQCRG